MKGIVLSSRVDIVVNGGGSHGQRLRQIVQLPWSRTETAQHTHRNFGHGRNRGPARTCKTLMREGQLTVKKTQIEDLPPELVAPLKTTNAIVLAYLAGLDFIIRDTRRDPTYLDNHLLPRPCTGRSGHRLALVCAHFQRMLCRAMARDGSRLIA